MIAQPEQRLRLRSGSLPFRRGCCPQGCPESQRLPDRCSHLRGYESIIFQCGKYSSRFPALIKKHSIANNIKTGIKAKVENKGQYEQYLEELKPLREELSIPLKEDLYPEESK